MPGLASMSAAGFDLSTTTSAMCVSVGINGATWSQLRLLRIELPPVNMDIAVNGICESICISGPHGTVIKTLRLIKFYFYRNLMAGIDGKTKRRLESGRFKALLASWSSFYLHFELLVQIGTGF